MYFKIYHKSLINTHQEETKERLANTCLKGKLRPEILGTDRSKLTLFLFSKRPQKAPELQPVAEKWRAPRSVKGQQ